MTRKKVRLPSHVEFRSSLGGARDAGADCFEWENADLIQSAEYATSILPELRRMAGYTDHKRIGTWTVVPRISGMAPEEVEAELSGSLDELLGSFWDGYWERRAFVMGDDDDDDDDGDRRP
jgi:hypothetical protein